MSVVYVWFKFGKWALRSKCDQPRDMGAPYYEDSVFYNQYLGRYE